MMSQQKIVNWALWIIKQFIQIRSQNMSFFLPTNAWRKFSFISVHWCACTCRHMVTSICVWKYLEKDLVIYSNHFNCKCHLCGVSMLHFCSCCLTSAYLKRWQKGLDLTVKSLPQLEDLGNSRETIRSEADRMLGSGVGCFIYFILSKST